MNLRWSFEEARPHRKYRQVYHQFCYWARHQSSHHLSQPCTSRHQPPCPGLTPECDSRIATYLTRSQVSGGSSKARHVISQELLGKLLGDVDPDKLTRIYCMEANESRWLNFREQQLIHSVACLKRIPSSQRTLPCHECTAILKDQIFKNALSRPLPKLEHLKYTVLHQSSRHPHCHERKFCSPRFHKLVKAFVT